MKTKNLFLKSAVIMTLALPSSVFADSQCDGAQAVGATCNKSGLEGKLNTIFDTLFYIVGALAVIILIVGGIRYITSTGDAKRIQQAKDTIFYAIAGLILAILARTIVGFVIGKLA